ncbi:uncharacterized protein H6S33_001462 [Morchella sextelata]|uniref:uncharacterized protein n=1 Tax=Morchella sextelata TaxID=1174677 RepID=UPI001D03B772|nr:uncharacterized protein H6S33_001462 [Morchella sextelata]KAH0608328.1 hypothetical protein H6S33_001462 [Morchella sextelata]
MIPGECLGKDDEALAADPVKFRISRRKLNSVTGVLAGSESNQYEMISAKFCGIDTEEEKEEEELELELSIVNNYEEGGEEDLWNYRKS